MSKNYGMRSLMVFSSQFALLFIIFLLVGTYYANWGYPLIAGISLIVLFFQYLISPIIIQWIYSIDWMDPGEVANRLPHIAQIIDQVVTKYNIRAPRFGIIHDGSPNAFTFGWTKHTARIVITDGILNLLDKEEQRGVVAHELGHIKHNDFIVMTLASAIPMLFYTIFRMLMYSRSSRSSSRDSNNSDAYKYAIAILSYIMYIVGTLIMLMLSRIREYWSDEFSAQETGNANALSTSLVKIAYGLLQTPSSGQGSGGSGGSRTYRGGQRGGQTYTGSSRMGGSTSRVQFIKGLGISDRTSAKNLIYSAGGSSGKKQKDINTDIIAKSAAWDLYTPWAKYFNVMSTHPLPAKRIQRLNQISEQEQNTKAVIDLTPARAAFEKEMGKSGWDEFTYELIVQYMPKLIFFGWLIAGLILWATGFDFTSIPFGLFNNVLAFMAFSFVFAGAFHLLQNLIKYNNDFKKEKLQDLITTIRVSPVRPVPCVVRGQIMGKGAPGLFWSDDVFIRDKTAIMYIDYDYGIGLINTLFGIFRVNKMIGRNCEVVGWYRRGPRPYIQVHTIQLDDGKIYHCRKKFIWQIVGVLLLIIGLALWWYANGA